MIVKCLFPVAGYGTRFLPATKAQPKEMLPILTKPLIQYGVEEAAEAGLTQACFVTGRNKRAIADHFDTVYELEDQIKGTSREDRLACIRGLIEECSYSYTRQNQMRGLGDAILTGKILIGDDEPFGVILADDLCVGEEGIMSQMLKVYEKYKCCVVAVEEVPIEEVSKYGVISGQTIDDRHTIVETMVEKPTPEEAPSNLAIIGRYILTPAIFDTISRTPPGVNGEVQLTDALQTLAKEEMVVAYRFEGRRFDCGSIDGFVEATNYFYAKMKEAEKSA
ncbi:UTP--glucose-1-phosphate uridylyltransferase GalU [Mariprofundus ferrooxydans]|uniref:UTP--glucose-1-phosphate uridylyltransferase n=1 Tax=Mariprofundus ferrooxydans PV-1 TaxID=314345 RepID=Q0EWS9_9PROT|nr:UTP--glucose-1-phosphate uridylyltransferase GalU [Mariprofundus ferrooxydans]EAU53710.1 UTP-glucose-1-phosphate uridylyltransferase [Mariprofundus ferrooxydans PV-1]KON48527.1 UTP--glucose-1-phosphate uridylyltransferase [Mariprofundus ferrooxydans]